ncbi:WYL domain-containing protein [Aliarcobacter cryaerophilus]|uniref:AAA family ATPase n=1 Tax=Aliarcobacter cryaerophilus TaxID=28198 RepID=UPI0021B5964F|nr:WYL domain-containing protein [Aliarcobacter cryaerophilus]MCT7535859.1 WYL domain-containing protein [Aliarcobacter cryaerophilus]
MAKIYPTIENIQRLKVKPTDGERYLIDYLIKKFDDDVEIFFQPFLNGDRPDIVLLKRGIGATIIEVKDWDLKNYKIDQSNQWYLKSNNQKIKSPFQQVYHYKDNMFNLHVNGMLEEKIKNPKFYGRINAYVYFHNATKQDLINLYENLDFNQSKLEKINRDIQYTAITRDNIKIYLPKNDDLALFKDSIYDEFKRILQPIKHTIEEGIEIKYTNSQEKLIQSKIIHEKIRGIAGSGKTTILAKRAVNAYKRHNEEVLILTYNITLKRYIHDKISDVRDEFNWDNFHITNYHNFLQGIFNKVGIEIIVPEVIQQEAKNSYYKNNDVINDYLEKKYYSNMCILDDYLDELPKYKTILVDEIQDYKAEWIKIIRKYFAYNDSEIVLYGDEKQNIYERELEEDKTSKIVQGFGKWKNIGQSIRFIREGSRISNLAKKFQLAFFTGKYEIDKDLNNNEQQLLDLGIFTSLSYSNLDSENYERITESIFNKIKVNNIHPNEVTILCSRISVLKEIDFLIRKKFNEKTTRTFESKELYERGTNKYEIENIRKIKKIAFNQNSGLIKLSTVHSYKGFESDCIFLIIHPDDNEEIVYAGITRSKFNLMIFTPENSKFLDFFNIELGKGTLINKMSENLNILKESIKKKELISIKYRLHNKEVLHEKIKPYKILFMNDNYYLACETNNEYKFSMYRINNILEINQLGDTFCYDMDLLDFVENIQTPFAKYSEDFKEKLIKVLLEVDKTKISFFENKKFLPSQEIVEKLDNGNLILSFFVTQEIEIEDLIKRWIPYLKVIEPISLDEKIKSDIRKYLI